LASVCGSADAPHCAADACIAALNAPAVADHTYNLSGLDTISYHDMVIQIFKAIRRPARLLRLPLFAFQFAAALLHLVPRHRNWSPAMAERNFGFKPRPFTLSFQDVSP